MGKIAALLTCFNRKDKTLACLQSLFRILPDVDVYVTNDGCTDGTPEAIRMLFPSVKIIEGTGNLFWSRGMHRSWSEAIKGNYDFYLWLNDDIELYPDFFDELMTCYKIGGNDSVIVGIIKNIADGTIIYGGTDDTGKLIQETATPQKIKNMNGNVVLVPKCVVERIGIIDPVFWHDIGDVDYGLTAQKNGIKVLSTRKAVAGGYSNGKFCRVRKWNTSIVKRFKKLYSPLGSNPNIAFYFYKKHQGILKAVTFYIYLHVLNLLPDMAVKAIWGNKYVENK